MVKIKRTSVDSQSLVTSVNGSREAVLKTYLEVNTPFDMSDIAFRAHVAVAQALGAGRPRIERIIASGPATVVFWDDGEKTVVKCRECVHCSRKNGACGFVSPYDSEKAVMAAMLKRLAPGWQDDVREAEGEW